MGTMEEKNQNSKTNKMSCSSSKGLPDIVLGCVMPYIDDPEDRGAVSLVCRQWYELEALTRKHLTIELCYTTNPQLVRRRFRNLESLKLKGKPRAAKFNLIPEGWGGNASPWVNEIAVSFNCLKSVHFKRMIVRDSDLYLLATYRGRILQVLKVDTCSGFSTDGLLHVGRFCRQLRTISLRESSILEKDGDWLHEIAMNNTVLERLNFFMTDLTQVRIEDLHLIAKNCRSLVSVKISDSEILDLIDFFHAAAALEEFGGGSFDNAPEKYSDVIFPPKLCHLCLTYIGKNEMPIVFPFASRLKSLDLSYALLDTDDHCFLIQKCCNLEVLQTRNVIGDRGLEVLASNCKRLKKLRVEHGAADEQGIVEGQVISERGLIALAQGCLELESMVVYASHITNRALEQIGTSLRNLNDFRIGVLDRDEGTQDMPFDNGLQALLGQCEKLQTLGLFLPHGALTDVGLAYIGQYSQNVKWMLLCYSGETYEDGVVSDKGLLALAKGCPNLLKLGLRGFCFTESALAKAAIQLTSLNFFWVHGYKATSNPGHDLLAMARPFWNTELMFNQVGEDLVATQPITIVSYYSVAGTRTDCPKNVVPLDQLGLLPLAKPHTTT